MENKVTLSYSFSETGDENLFLTLSTKLVESLSNYTAEWHHAYGRKTRSFQLKTKILPLTSALLNRNDLVTRPYCHIFWTDCNEIDQYKANIKPEITSWLKLLSKQVNCEWVIVLITGDVMSRIAKGKLLPRTSLTDKIKADFCMKCPERFHIIHDPNRDSKNSETWASLSTKVAAMTVRCMEAVVAKYEDQVRTERERRNEMTWDFCTYFLLQEELAFMYEMLGMCKLAQVQYDELDAMFTQYVLNANAGDFAHWLGDFSKPIDRWHSLLLWKPVDNEARLTIQKGHATLIDLRNYLFSRLCFLLFQIGKLCEVVDRLRYFLHSIATEIEILEISIPIGAIECWTFMSCLELVEALKNAKERCELKNNSTEPDSIISSEKLLLEYASLWNLARLKLQNLGKLCGLMPNIETTSGHLQLVVDLVSGMGEGEERGDSTVSPALILREALSSKNNFQKHYFELSELAIGTFKHMKHYRAARSIGKDLAEFYMLLGQPEKAESYLVDAVRTYASDGWESLYSNANRVLARCYKQMSNIRKYLRLCYALMCDNHLDEDERLFYCDEISTSSCKLAEKSLSLNLWPLASVSSVRFLSNQTSFRQDEEQFLELSLFFFAPKPIVFHALHISLEHSTRIDENVLSQLSNLKQDSANKQFEKADHSSRKNFASNKPKQGPRFRHRHASTTSSKELMSDQIATMDSEGRVELLSLNYNDPPLSQVTQRPAPALNFAHLTGDVENGQLSWAGVTCKHVHELLRRQDSNPSQRTKHSAVTSVVMENYDVSLSTEQLTLHPGENLIKVPLKTHLPGSYQLQQIRLTLHRMYFLLPRIYPVITYAVTQRKPTITLQPTDGLICGLVQELSLIIDLGDYVISGTENDVLIVDLSSKVYCLKYQKCLVSTTQGVANELQSPLISFTDGLLHWQLPSSSGFRKIILTFLCICVVDEVYHKKENSMRHRRTKSAPSASFFRSSKPLFRTESGPEESKIPVSQTNEKDEEKVTKFNVPPAPHPTPTSSTGSSERKSRAERFENIKNSLKESFKSDSTPFKIFRSRTNVDSMKKNFSSNQNKVENSVNLPLFTISDDFIEVTLDEPDDVTSTSSDIRSQDSSMLKGDAWSLTTSLEFDSGPSSEKLTDTFKLASSRSIVEATPPPTLQAKPPLQSRVPTITCKVMIEAPWVSVPSEVTSLSFAQPCEFSHAWNHSAYDRQFVSVTISNITSVSLTLRNPTLTFTNVENARTVHLGKKLIIVKPEGICLFVWRVSIPSTLSNISSRFQASISSHGDHFATHEGFSKITYNFDIDRIRPIYRIESSTDDVVKSCHMTSLRVRVERLREDPGHVTTANGQQLLMYQVVDNRGRWAVCGKSSGILSFKCEQLASDDEGSASAEMEVMPLVCGRLHLPYITLHRYIKRSSEYDDRYGTSDSPVLKPPQLKPFECGEVIYRDQARQISVLPGDEADEGPAVTSL